MKALSEQNHFVGRNMLYRHEIFPVINHGNESSISQETRPLSVSESSIRVGNKRSYQESNENGSWIPVDVRASRANGLNTQHMLQKDIVSNGHYMKKPLIPSNRDELYTSSASHKLYDDGLLQGEEGLESQTKKQYLNGNLMSKTKLV